MKFGLPISLALHGGLLAVSVVGFGFKAKAVTQPQVIPVKIFTISDTTNVRAAKKAPVAKAIETPEDISPPPEPEPISQQASVPEPEPGSEQVLVPEPEPEPELAVTAEPEPAEDAQAVIEPQPAPKPEKPKPLSLDDLSALVAGSKGKTEARDQKILQGERKQIELAEASRLGSGQGTGLTTAYEDAIMRRIYNAWRIPVGALSLNFCRAMNMSAGAICP